MGLSPPKLKILATFLMADHEYTLNSLLIMVNLSRLLGASQCSLTAIIPERKHKSERVETPLLNPCVLKQHETCQPLCCEELNTQSLIWPHDIVIIMSRLRFLVGTLERGKAITLMTVH